MEYLRPETLTDLNELLTALSREQYQLLAGGTDLMPRFEQGQPLPEKLIDIKKIPGLSGITDTEDHIEIGALTTLEEIRRSPIVKEHLPALLQAANYFAAIQIRNRATIGGNICNASPAGDTLPVLYVLDARLHISALNSERKLHIKDFITGPGQTGLQSGEILARITIPKPGGIQRFFKLGLREAMAISVVNFAMIAQINLSGQFTVLKIAAGAVAPTIVYLSKLVKAIVEGEMQVSQAIDKVDSDITPIDDIRASAQYRRKVLKNVLQFELEQILTDQNGISHV